MDIWKNLCLDQAKLILRVLFNWERQIIFLFLTPSVQDCIFVYLSDRQVFVMCSGL